MRIYLIFNCFWGVIYKFWQIIFEAFVGKFVFNFECVYTSKFPCIVIVDTCVRSYIPILQINWQTSFVEFKVEFQLLNLLVLTYLVV